MLVSPLKNVKAQFPKGSYTIKFSADKAGEFGAKLLQRGWGWGGQEASSAQLTLASCRVWFSF